MQTKVATHKTPEYHYFYTTDEEEVYWESICSICFDRDCEDDCILYLVPGLEDCKHCEAKGIVTFLHYPGQMVAPYNVITICGMCDGLGLV